MSIIILIFMTLPTVTSITFAIYNCVDVFNDGNTYLALDVSM
jgi:ABC-type phosphate transport system permease subunit